MDNFKNWLVIQLQEEYRGQELDDMINFHM